MKLTAPLYALKRRAKFLSRRDGVPLHTALDRVACEQGYGGWSLLAAKAASRAPAAMLLSRLTPGDCLLLGARPGQGKTLLALELVVEAMNNAHCGAFFTLEYTERDIVERFGALGAEAVRHAGRFIFDSSDEICADHIVRALSAVPRGTLAVVDYLQLLDQKRVNPDLMEQMRSLRGFGGRRGVIFVFISQIDRSFDLSGRSLPDIGDVRLPNPLDLSLFNKHCFLHNGDVRFHG